MNTTVLISLIVLIILIIVFIYVGIWFKRFATTSEDFLLAGRGAPFWLLASAYLGGYVGGASVSGYVGLGFRSGISGMWASLFVVSGCALFVVIFARRLNYFGRKTGAVTITDFLCTRYGEAIRVPAGIISLLRPTFLTGMQFLAIAIIANIVFGLPIKIGVVVSAVIILLYLITAGQYSALITQWFQSVLQAAGIVLFAVAAYKVVGDPNTVTNAFYEILPETFVNMWSVDMSTFTVQLLTLGVFYLCDPWIYMWSYIGESPKVSSNGMLAVLGGSYYNVLPFLSGMAILVGTMAGKLSVPEGLSDDAVYAWFTVNFTGTAIGVIILVGLLMTIISCGSSFAMNGVTIITRDIYQKAINKNATDKQAVFASRISLVIVTVIGIVSALWLPILVPLWILAQAIVISGLFAATMSAWFWKRSTSKGAMASILGGGIASLLWALYVWFTTGSPGGTINGFHAVHVGMIVSIPLMIIVSLATKPEYELANVTSFKTLGEELKTSKLIKEEEKQTRGGFFGWLGADTPAWKIFWIVVAVIFALHYILGFLFHQQLIGIAMVWVALIVGVVLFIILAVLGGRDLGNMVKAGKELETKK
jgi:SSS family solute:Na+ symporter